MSVSRGSGNGDNRNGGAHGAPPDMENWGVSTQEMDGNDPPVDDGVPVEWDDDDEVTGAHYFSEADIMAVQQAADAALEVPVATAFDIIPDDSSAWEMPAQAMPAAAPKPESTPPLPAQPPVHEPAMKAAAPVVDAARPVPQPLQTASAPLPHPAKTPSFEAEPRIASTIAEPKITEQVPSKSRALSRSIPPPPFATPSMMPPPKTYESSSPALVSQQAFRAETHKLALDRDYRSVAALHEAALEQAAWAKIDDIQIGLLLDLARLYRDRLSDRTRAQATFERLASLRPGHEEAIAFLSEAYEAQGNMRALHDLFASAVDEEWSPDRRVELTRNAARIALELLHDPAAAARDWERLLDLGDMNGQVTVELSRVYREAERWTDLGEFLENRATACAGTTRVAILREAVESFLAGAKDLTRAESLIQQILGESADDPIALASLAHVYAKQSRWADLEAIAKRPMTHVPPAAALDVLRLTAELLTQAGQHDRAASAYDRVLAAAPNDKDAVRAREEYLSRKGDHEGLVKFLVARAERVRVPEEKAKRLQHAAEVADNALGDAQRAATLWQKCVEANPNNPAAYEALVSLYDRLNDVEGITRALEGLAAITTEPKSRAALLRRLGQHYAYRADNDDAAQRCWLEVASLCPEDLSVHAELNGVHRRRGDFAALDTALTRQLWRTTDHDQAVTLAREVARNLDENLNEPERTIRAWVHVLELAPDDAEALSVLTNELGERKTTTEVQGILEQRLQQSSSLDERVDLGLELARNWEERGDRSAALATYERVRAWAPADDRVLDALVRLYAEQSPGDAMSVLEIAAANVDSPARAGQLLARAVSLVPEDKAHERFFLLRRLLRFGAGKGLEETVHAATQAKAWPDLASLYERHAEAAPTPDTRRTYRLLLARLCQNQLQDPNRAFVAVQSLGLSALKADDIETLAKLCESTQRWEDLLAVLDAALEPNCPRDVRCAILRRRADICEQHLKDPHRAFMELQRLVQSRQDGPLDEVETQALEDMRRLAQAHGLIAELKAVYDELWDRAPDDEARVHVARVRQGICRDQMQDPARALEHLLIVLRLRPQDPNVAQEVLQEAEALNQWQRALPVLEAAWRAGQQSGSQLVQLARLYRERCSDPAHAVELLCEALRLEPANADVQQELESLGDASGRWPRIVQAIRFAAALEGASPRALELARCVASLCRDKLHDEPASLHAHRWILQVWPNELESLETVIQAHRQANEYVDLRTRLEQWIDRSSERHVERWLEVGRLCNEHLNDSAGALIAYGNVIELDPGNEEAADTMRKLADVSLPVALRRKQVRVELARANGERRIDLLLQLAELEKHMGETDAAIGALRELYATENGRDRAFGPLSSLLREASRWQELASLYEDLAAAKQDTSAKLTHLREALAVAQEQLDEPARTERLLRQLLAIAPDDTAVFARLARLLRSAGRFAELATELRSRLDEHASSHEAFDQRAMTRELVRLLHLALDQSKEAEAVLRKADSTDADAALWLATMALARQEHSAYIEQRRRHLGKLPKRLGALVICHLAEYCDQFMKLKGRVLALYREARTLDADNTIAADALRGLGRGVRNWRATAALLPVPNEETFSIKDRAARLRRLGDASRDSDPIEAINWYERAVAVDADNIEAWDALSQLNAARQDHEYAFIAAWEACAAFERTTAPASAAVAQLARRLAETAVLAARANKPSEAAQLSATAYALDPNVPSAAMLAADSQFELGAMDRAAALYSRILERLSDSLSTTDRAHALHRRALAAIGSNQIEAAHDDLAEALAACPMHAEALDAMAEVLRRQSHPVKAALHELRALLVTRQPEARGKICRRVGELCDTELARADEAGAWFELAVEAGIEDKTLMRRLLHHFRRTGRSQQALAAISELIETTTDPLELADLWATRGAIVAERDLDSAEEALDIALSFNPSHPTAMDTLRAVLEQRGDYEQLAALLDARTESGTDQERAAALRALADMCFEHLQDEARAEQYLQRLVELEPSREAFERLLTLVQADPARESERLPLLSRLLGCGGPFCECLIEATKIITAQGRRHWAWAVLSALMGAAPVDSWTKATLGELRREFERFDGLSLLRPELVSTLGAEPALDPLVAALTDLAARLYLASDDGSLPPVDVRTGPGKVFERITEQLAMTARVVRSPEGGAAVGVLSGGEVPVLCVRTDLLAAPPGELAFVYVYGLMLARSSTMALASVPEEHRSRLVEALVAASSDDAPTPDDPVTAALSTRIVEALSPEETAAWRQHLGDLPACQTKVAKLFEAMELAAMKMALVAAGDVRTAMRALARLAPDNKRPPGVARLEDFESFFESMAAAPALFGFATSEEFGAVLG